MGADLGKVEQEALSLLDALKFPADIGKVYASIAHMYAEHSGGKQPKKAISYATRALEYPLEPVDKARVYLGWGVVLWAQCNTVDSQEHFRHRREISRLLLKSLALFIEMGVPEEPAELPSVDKFDIDSRDPEYQNYVKRHEMEMAARKRAEETNRFQFLPVVTAAARARAARVRTSSRPFVFGYIIHRVTKMPAAAGLPARMPLGVRLRQGWQDPRSQVRRRAPT